MGKIAKLPDILASQVAAGEVVERPASVIKELVENALDAGASHIVVEIQKGGVSQIKITDDGCGMSREDALMSLERHATSKLKDVQGLARIGTMGFRGEAVPSVASVSKLKMLTREIEAAEGTEILVEGGEVKEVRVGGGAQGTVFEVKQLFYNIPARKKFLRTEATEAAHVEHQVRLHALAHPSVRFTFRKDGRQVFDLPATLDKRLRIVGLHDRETGKKLIEIPTFKKRGRTGDMALHGYLLPSEFARKGRRQQYLFLNGRPVEDAAISGALKEGYQLALAEGLNPMCWLWLELDPGMVDVNVHPAKKEVRFHYPLEVRSLVLGALEGAFAQHFSKVQKSIAQEPSSKMPARSGDVVTERDEVDGAVDVVTPVEADLPVNAPPQGDVISKNTSKLRPQGANAVSSARGISSPLLTKQTQQELVVTKNEPKFKVLEVLHCRYVLMESEEGLVLLDPKAARRRVVYEKMMHAAEYGGVEAQQMLVPEVVQLDVRDLVVVLENRANLAEAGIEVESFGGDAVQLRSMPGMLAVPDVAVFLKQLIDALIATQGGKRAKKFAFESIADSLAKQAAKLEKVELRSVQGLLDELFDCDLPYCTPDGSPTLVQISLAEIEKKFS